MDDGVIRRFPAHVLVRPWILNPITEVERAYERPETVELRTEIWRQGGSLSYRVIQASTEDPDQLDAIPTFRRPAEKVLR